MRLKLLLVALAAVSLLRAADSSPDPHIAQIENGLLAPAIIAGRSPETWTLAARMAYYQVPGVSLAIIDHGTIAGTRAYGVVRSGEKDTVTPDTLFQAGSLGKPLTAAAALSLVEAGRLSLDADINAALKSWHLPASPVAEGAPVTLRELLSHTAGLNVDGFEGYAAGAPLPTLLQVLDGRPPANTEPVRLTVKPSTLWRYSGGGYCVVQQLLTDVTGRDFPSVVRERVLAPAGLTASTFDQPLPAPLAARAAAGHDENGRCLPGDARVYPALAASGLWSTPADLARFALALGHSLAGTGEPRLFSRATAETMLSVPLAGSDYGLGLGVKGSGDRIVLSHSGATAGFRALFVAYPRLGCGAVIMTNGDNGTALIGEILRAIARAYQWPDYQPEVKPVVPLAPEAFDAFAGRYEREDTVLVFYRKDDRFYLRATNQPRVEIFPQSDHEFFLLGQPDLYTFAQDSTGRVTHVIRRARGTIQLFPRGEQ